MRGEPVRPIVIAAGGTGGHFFPAEALASELLRRGHRVALLTDSRSGGERSAVFAGREAFVLPGAGIAGRGALRGAAALLALARGTAEARRVLARLQPAVLVGFGGYPSVPPVVAARLLRRRPRVILHEQNAVLGRANRLLARWADGLALGVADTSAVPEDKPTVVTGNPVRPEIAALAGTPYVPPEPGAPLRVLVTGGSQGARIFSTALPAALGRLPATLRQRLRLSQQCRKEDLERVRATYAGLGIEAELSPFFGDMAQRLMSADFVIARAGASTVAELAIVGRPALLVPFPHAIDNHQLANARAIDALVIEQSDFERRPDVLAEKLRPRLESPDWLMIAADAIARHAIPDAASRLADLVESALAREVTV
ncbi:MAG: UDP-N-acetylglucosamine--N-acetylmuramyl-(pentapeptide) pyrophosphoryl-undecaprenol N-acetylglucosamine transferase [Acetobacteraceae bacterium]|nr:UDP-N-acetylglucosamine--N-acetylmuramyl-(pentapeptide) pyrophosphoryl-undecaprenol N-acetylglucosamine transferase [Acetobacteraceae bacterium]